MSTAAQPKFEDCLRDLETILQELEEGQVGLQESLARYEQGVKLLRHCYGLLEQAERRIELCTGVDADGNPVVQPFDEQALSLEEKADARSRRRSKPVAKAKSEPTATEEAPFDTDDQRDLF